MGGQGRKRGGTEQDSSPTPASSEIAIIQQEQVVTAFIKAYLNGRERWLKIVLAIYGVILVVLMVWFTIISGQLIEWNNYKARAIKVLDNSEKALEDWRRATGLTDTTGVNNGTRAKE
jgi:hypothetical protein